MAVGDIYQGQIFYNIGSELTMNVVHILEIATCTDPIPAETVAKVIHGIWASRYATATFSDESKVTLIQTRRIKPTSGVPATAILGTPDFPEIIGTGVGAPVPPQAAALISLYTDVFTKNGRGRLYIPGVDRTSQNDGQLLVADVARMGAFADDLEADIVSVGPQTGTWHFAVYSRALGTAQEVTQGIAHTNMASQRGRRNFPGIGT